MENVLYGIPTALGSAIALFFSWKCQRKGNFQLAVLLLVLGGLLLRIFVSCDFFLYEWDERFHALVAKPLIR